MDLEREITILKERINKLEKEKRNNFNLDKRATNEDIVSKSYRFHQTAIDDFNKTIKKKSLKVYTVQDLLSQALWEFCEKYKDLE